MLTTTNLTAQITRRPILSVFFSAVIFCAIILYGLSVSVPTASAATTPQILISPSSAGYSVGQTFTMTINLTGFTNLYLYQLVFKYNGTVLNLTNLWFPANNVFSGHNVVTVWSNDTEAAGDTVDHLNYTMAGQSLIGTGSVSVTNGVLCDVNFTAVGLGQSTIAVATKDAPANAPTRTWYTYCQDPASTEYDIFVTPASTITVPEFTPILLMMMLPILAAAVLIARKKLGRRA
ncbi:MAG: cohesin domain-containing protein [Candidatus Bathyarchaeia archaeon]